MKNLKKVLALALAFAMAFSMFANAAFTDAAAISADHADNVAMLVELGVLGGYPDGSFKPENTITRAEFTKMAYTIKYGYDDAGKLFAGSASKFTDVEGNSAIAWAKGYINYCATQGIIGGVGNNKFNPNGNVTVAEAAKMLLVILGCDAAKEGYGGANWMGNVVSDAMELGVFEGWVGDPTAPATRELVATLMANTIFAPVYVYNPITGLGTQQNLLGNTHQDNETLGEKTMGLKRIEGTIVANDNVYITKDADGKAFKGIGADEISVANDEFVTFAIEKTDEDGVYYSIQNFKYDVPNEYVGAKAAIYFTEKNKETKVIGDLVLSSDTIIYDLTSSDIKIMPDGKGNGPSGKVQPYIAIDTGDKVYNLKPRGDASRDAVAGNKEYGKTEGQNALLNYFYFPVSTDLSADKEIEGKLDNPTTLGDGFYTDLWKDSIQSYRAVSVDGGKTISYIFRTATKSLEKVKQYNVDNDVIQVGNITINDLEENLVVEGDIAKGDEVITWKESDKLYVCATDEVVGKASVIEDNLVTIGDNEYRADLGIFELKTTGYTHLRTKDGIAFFYADNSNVNTDTAAYIAYNGYLLKVENTGATVDVAQYAVALSSSWDYDESAAKVRLAFADESSATYFVARIDNAKINSNNKTWGKAEAWNNDVLLGRIFRYTLNSDGTVNLFTDEANIKATKNVTAANQKFMGMYNGNLVVEYDSSAAANMNQYDANAATTMSFDENAVFFMLYGGAATSNESDRGKYERVNAVVYKMADFEETQAVMKEIYTYPTADSGIITSKTLAYVKSADKYENAAVLAAFPVGAKKIAPKAPETAPLAIVLNDMKYVQDAETNEYYANVKMITEDGLVETKTIASIHETIGESAPSYGKIVEVFAEAGEASGQLTWGTLISYTYDDEGLVKSITLKSTPAHMKANVGAAEFGWSYATISDVTASRISYFNYNAMNDLDTSDASVKAESMKINKHGVKVWAIDGEEVVDGGDIETISRGDEIPAEGYNAIVHVDNGIDRVISFYGFI